MIKTEINLNIREHTKFIIEMDKKMQEKDMTIIELADEIGVSPKTIWNFRGDRNKKPSKYLAAKIHNYLGLNEKTYKDRNSFFFWILPFMLALFIPVQAQARVVYDEDLPLSYYEQYQINKMCEENDVCYELVLAIAEHESRFQADAVSSDGMCLGMCQLHKSFHKCDNFFDRVQNAEACITYLKSLFDEYEDDGLVLSIYHGESNAFETYKDGKMSGYASEILERSAELERKHGK